MKDDELGRSYSDGEIIFKEDEKGEVMYIIQSGKVKITKKTASGELTIAILESGEIFGEMALFDRLPRSATAIAVGNTNILSIDKKKLFSIISRDPTIAFKMLETMSQRIRRLDEEVSKLKENKLALVYAFMDVDETCNFILEEAKNIIRADNGSIMLIDDDKKSLSIKVAFGSEAEPKVRFLKGIGIAGDVVKSGKAEMVNNVLMDSRFIQGALRIDSLMCVPLKYKDNVFGVINMSNSSEKLFSLDDFKLLCALSIYASIAIQNAKIFSNLKNVIDEFLKRTAVARDIY